MAAFLLISTLLTIAGLIATSILGFLSTPVHAAQHILFALGTVHGLTTGSDTKGALVALVALVVAAISGGTVG